jgi:flavodoxin
VDLFKTMAWPVVFKYDLKQAYRNLVRFFKVSSGKMKDPYDSYDFLFLEKGRWKKKIVYFMAGGKSKYDLYDSYYKKAFKGLVLKVQKAGYEIGLHPSFETADNLRMLMKEKKTIERESSKRVKHSRQHFLHFFPNKTSELIQKAGFKTDSSLGFTKRIGFRTGTGFEHHLYDFINEKAFDFQELPLVLMDSSLIHQTAGNMEEFRKQLISFMQMNNKGTQITLNFHNSTFDSTIKERKLLKSIYLEMEALVNSL